jgi:hypothetical protein
MRNQKATAVIVICFLLMGLCIMIALGLEIFDGIKSAQLIDKAGVAAPMAALLKKNGMQQWVVVALGAGLVFAGIGTLAWTNQKRI